MNDTIEYLWRVFEFNDGFGKSILMSERKMSDQEVDAVFEKMRFSVDLIDLGVNYMYTTNFGLNCISCCDEETAETIYKKAQKSGHLLKTAYEEFNRR